MFNSNDTHKIGFIIFLGAIGILALIISSFFIGFRFGFIEGFFINPAFVERVYFISN